MERFENLGVIKNEDKLNHFEKTLSWTKDFGLVNILM